MRRIALGFFCIGYGCWGGRVVEHLPDTPVNRRRRVSYGRTFVTDSSRRLVYQVGFPGRTCCISNAEDSGGK